VGVVGKLREQRWRAAGHYDRRFGPAWLEPLRGGVALEVGGPSALFRADGLLPVYPLLTRVDGVQWSPRTVWHGAMDEGAYDVGAPRVGGRLWIREGGDLAGLGTASYDVVLSSHVLEHLANPLGALREWLRVLRPDGHLLTVLPHMAGCADHRRAVTPLEHLVEDERRGTPEDDRTHLEEVIRVHDLERDPTVPDRAALRARALDNPRNRTVHHHVFTTRSALAMLDHVGLDLLQAEVRYPHDIYVLARLPAPGSPPVDNAALLDRGAGFLRASPFRVDRR
jgi:SAM-dependent methyltransferase